jgi:hypothetical protein
MVSDVTGEPAPWLGRFRLPTVIRAGGAFHYCSALDAATGERRLVVVPAPKRDAALARVALRKLADAHARLDHPHIARVADRGEHGGVPFVAFECAAVAELGELLKLARRSALRPPHAEADGFILGLREALQAAHAAPGPGGPMHLGSLSYGNIVFAADGRHWLVGFGHNVATHDEAGEPVSGEATFQAPEVAVGEPPSPSGDFVALLLLMRSIIPSMRFEPAVARVLTGRTLREDFELVQCILWIERRVMAAPPGTRATIDEAIVVSNRIRALLGVTPDPAGFERTAAAALQLLMPERVRARGALRLGPDAAWFEAPDGSRHELGTRRAMRRVLLALAAARLNHPGTPLTVSSLVEAGWPGERPRSEAGANRVYVVLSALRRMGLRAVLERHDDGYRLSPQLPVTSDSPL